MPTLCHFVNLFQLFPCRGVFNFLVTPTNTYCVQAPTLVGEVALSLESQHMERDLTAIIGRRA